MTTGTPSSTRLASTRLGFPLDAVKLAVPQRKRRFVARPALVKRLQRAKDSPVIFVGAPAGYGKTTLLAQWAARDARPFAYVSLDRRDNDPAVLMTYLAAALDTIYDVDPGLFEALSTPGLSIWSGDAPRLLATFTSLPGPFVLALDDVHEIDDRDCCDLLEALCHRVPDGACVALAGRNDGRLGIARLRARGLVTELGSADLAFDDAEARVLLQRSGVATSEAEARELNARAEGWPTGLYLATLGGQLEPGRGETSTRLAGDDRFIVDYLRDEYLSRLGRRRLQFLLRTSVLERMTGALCDAVLERSGSARQLEALERENLLVVPLDQRRAWYRYHHLLREMLLAELERTEPQHVADLHRRAAEWCSAHGQADAAIEHALAAGETGLVARLVVANGIAYYRSGRAATAERWFRAFDTPELLARYPAVTALGAFLYTLQGDPAAAERWTDALEQSGTDEAMPDGSPQRAWCAVLSALLCRDGLEQMGAAATRAAEELTAVSPFRAPALLLIGVSLFLEGEIAKADDALTLAAAVAVEHGAVPGALVAFAELGLIALGRGDAAAAQARVDETWKLVPMEAVGDYAPAALALALDARLALASGEVERARAQITRAQRLRAQLTHSLPWLSVQVRLELARAQLALADPDGARVLLDEADRITRRRPQLGTLLEQLDEVRALARSVTSRGSGWATTLTSAELRLLPLLTTHLSFGEIAERLYVSRNTVKTQAISIYRKLDVSSRSEAVGRARELGLVDAAMIDRAAT